MDNSAIGVILGAWAVVIALIIGLFINPNLTVIIALSIFFICVAIVVTASMYEELTR